MPRPTASRPRRCRSPRLDGLRARRYRCGCGFASVHPRGTDTAGSCPRCGSPLLPAPEGGRP